MSRSINESINQLQTSLSDIKTSLSAKNIEGGEQLKVSEVAGLINQIEAGGSGGFDVDNAKYISVDKDYPITVYDNGDGNGLTESITLTVDLTSFEEAQEYDKYFIIPLFCDLSFKDDNETFYTSHNWPQPLTLKQSHSSKITLTGESQFPMLFVILLKGSAIGANIANAEILDIKRIKVNTL